VEIVFATHNPNKLKELQQIIPGKIKLLSLNDINCNEDIVEDGKSIEENAAIKARYVHEKYGLNCFADDTGLCVDALNGAPGVLSARYAGPQKNANDNTQKLLNKLKDQSSRSAFFKTVIVYKSKTTEKYFTGICKGKILEVPRGNEGFGYDPVFLPKGHNHSFAEMSSELKNKISHRGLATQKLLEFLQEL
jgi:XTP/dITP diphosphohydrolase